MPPQNFNVPKQPNPLYGDHQGKPVWLKIILAISIALIVFIVTMYAIKYYRAAQQKMYTEESKTQVDINSDRSANWKTYTNSFSGFSVKYPDSLSIDIERSSTNEVVFNDGNVESRISIKVEPYGKNLNDWLKSLDRSSITKTQSIEIDGQTGLEIFTGEMGGMSGVAGVVHQGNLYTFNEVSKMKELGMLDTFKFDQPAPTINEAVQPSTK